MSLFNHQQGYRRYQDVAHANQQTIDKPCTIQSRPQHESVYPHVLSSMTAVVANSHAEREFLRGS